MLMHDITVTNISVKPNRINFIEDVELTSQENLLTTVVIDGGVKKLIDPENTSVTPLERKDLNKLPVASNAVDMAVALSPEISKSSNNQLIVRGSRPGSSSVYVDGVKSTNENSSMPRMAIGGMEIYTGGVPAKYGDFTGGVVIMRTASYFDLLAEYEARMARFEELAEMEKEMEKENSDSSDNEENSDEE